MAFYLPVLSAIVIGVSLLQGAISVAIAVGVVTLILYVALRHGHIVSRLFPADQYEPLLLGVLGLTMLVAGLAAQVGVSAAVGRVPRGHRPVGPGRGEREPGAHPAARPLRRDVLRVLRPHERLVGASCRCCCPRSRSRSSRSSRSSSPARTPPGEPASARSASGAPASRSPRAASSPSSSPASPSPPGWRPAIAPLATGYVLITIIAGTFLARLPDAAWFRAAVRRRPPRGLPRPPEPRRRGVGALTPDDQSRACSAAAAASARSAAATASSSASRGVGGVEEFAHPRHDLGGVALDAAHHRLVRQGAVGVLQVEARRADGAHGRGDLLRHGLGRSGVERAVRPGLVLEVLAASPVPSRARGRSGR